MAQSLPKHRAGSWYRPRSIFQSVALRPKVYSAALAGCIAAVLLPSSFSGSIRASAAGDIGAIVYLVMASYLMVTCNSDAVRARAEHQDDGRVVILVLVLIAIALSFWTIFGVLSQAKQTTGAQKALYTALAAGTVFLSWLVTQVAFTFHYAHEFYRPDDSAERLARGLEFLKDDKPDYWDFFYFATSIGAASQTSDVAIRTKALRRLVTLHAIMSFVFNTTLLALAINIGASLI